MRLTFTNLIRRIASSRPTLKHDLRIAHVQNTPETFVLSQFKFALPLALGMTLLFFFIVDKSGLPYWTLLIFFVIMFMLTFNFGFVQLKGKILRRKKEIDREVLFAGQYLLIKLYSGKPLLNALIETSKSYGAASKYIKEIVDDVDTGSPMEKALSNAMKYSPSEKFQKILFQINNALKLGIDVTIPLRSVLDEITKEQQIEVKRYGRTLNTVVIFYMLGAIVIPSVGMTIFIVISSFINFSVSWQHFMAAGFFIIIVELCFIAVFRSIRPTVDI